MDEPEAAAKPRLCLGSTRIAASGSRSIRFGDRGSHSAGTYTMSRASASSELLIFSRDNAVFVIPVVPDSTPE